jgi:hypothetical protein
VIPLQIQQLEERGNPAEQLRRQKPVIEADLTTKSSIGRATALRTRNAFWTERDPRIAIHYRIKNKGKTATFVQKVRLEDKSNPKVSRWQFEENAFALWVSKERRAI